MRIRFTAFAALALSAAPAHSAVYFQGNFTTTISIDLTPLEATGNWSASMSPVTTSQPVFQYGDPLQSGATSITHGGVPDPNHTTYGYTDAFGVAGYTLPSPTVNSIIVDSYVIQSMTFVLDPAGLGNTPPVVVLPISVSWLYSTSVNLTDPLYDGFNSISADWDLITDPGGANNNIGGYEFVNVSSYAAGSGVHSESASGSNSTPGLAVYAGVPITLQFRSYASGRADTLAVPSPSAAVPLLLLLARRRARRVLL